MTHAHRQTGKGEFILAGFPDEPVGYAHG